MSNRNNTASDDHPNADHPNEEAAMPGTKASTKDGYEVGYGKPPKHTQFQKGGKSPNPAGRRGKRVQSQNDLAAIFKSVMEETVRVKVGDRVVTMSGWEGGLRKMRNNAFEGDYRAWRILLLIARELKCLEPLRQALGGVLVVPRSDTAEEWEERVKQNQAKYRCNSGDREPGL